MRWTDLEFLNELLAIGLVELEEEVMLVAHNELRWIFYHCALIQTQMSGHGPFRAVGRLTPESTPPYN